MAESVELTVPADSVAMATLLSAIEAFCDANAIEPRPAYVLTLVVEELVTNVINHAYAGMRPGLVRLSIAASDGAVVGEVSDDGRAFDPTTAPPPDIRAELEDRTVGGLGVHIVRTLVDAFEYARDDERNVVRFRIAR